MRVFIKNISTCYVLCCVTLFVRHKCMSDEVVQDFFPLCNIGNSKNNILVTQNK